MAGNGVLQILRGTRDKIVNNTDQLLPGQLLYNMTDNFLYCGKADTQIQDLSVINTNKICDSVNCLSSIEAVGGCLQSRSTDFLVDAGEFISLKSSEVKLKITPMSIEQTSQTISNTCSEFLMQSDKTTIIADSFETSGTSCLLSAVSQIDIKLNDDYKISMTSQSLSTKTISLIGKNSSISVGGQDGIKLDSSVVETISTFDDLIVDILSLNTLAYGTYETSSLHRKDWSARLGDLRLEFSNPFGGSSLTNKKHGSRVVLVGKTKTDEAVYSGPLGTTIIHKYAADERILATFEWDPQPKPINYQLVGDTWEEPVAVLNLTENTKLQITNAPGEPNDVVRLADIQAIAVPETSGDGFVKSLKQENGKISLTTSNICEVEPTADNHVLRNQDIVVNDKKVSDDGLLKFYAPTSKADNSAQVLTGNFSWKSPISAISFGRITYCTGSKTYTRLFFMTGSTCITQNGSFSGSWGSGKSTQNVRDVIRGRATPSGSSDRLWGWIWQEGTGAYVPFYLSCDNYTTSQTCSVCGTTTEYVNYYYRWLGITIYDTSSSGTDVAKTNGHVTKIETCESTGAHTSWLF